NGEAFLLPRFERWVACRGPARCSWQRDRSKSRIALLDNNADTARLPLCLVGVGATIVRTLCCASCEFISRVFCWESVCPRPQALMPGRKRTTQRHSYPFSNCTAASGLIFTTRCIRKHGSAKQPHRATRVRRSPLRLFRRAFSRRKG